MAHQLRVDDVIYKVRSENDRNSNGIILHTCIPALDTSALVAKRSLKIEQTTLEKVLLNSINFKIPQSSLSQKLLKLCHNHPMRKGNR